MFYLMDFYLEMDCIYVQEEEEVQEMREFCCFVCVCSDKVGDES